MCTSDADRPLIVQLVGADAEEMAAAAAWVRAHCACDGVDINMGCPQNDVVALGCGAGLAADRARALRVARAVRDAVGPDWHVSCKIRLFAKRDATVAFACALASEARASAITVHGRTRTQMRAGACDWHAIASVAAALGALSPPVPVLANGGIYSAADAARCVATTGARAVMLAEPLLYDPMLCAGGCAGGARTPARLRAKVALVHEYVALARAHRQLAPFDEAEMVRQHVKQLLVEFLAPHRRSHIVPRGANPCGVPVDAALWERLADRAVWDDVDGGLDAMLAEIDAYARSHAGHDDTAGADGSE